MVVAMDRRARLSAYGLFAVMLLAPLAQTSPTEAQSNLTDEAKSLIHLLGDVYRSSSAYYQRIVTPVKATQDLLYKATNIPKIDCKQDACRRVCAEEGCFRSFCHSRNDRCYCGDCKLADLIAITKKRGSPVDYLSRPLEDCTPESCYVDCREQSCKESWCAFGSSCLCLFC